MISFKSIRSNLLVKIGLVAIVPLLLISVFNYRYFKEESIRSATDVQYLLNQHSATKIHLYLMAQQLFFIDASKQGQNVYYPSATPRSEMRAGLSAFLESQHPRLNLFDVLLVVNESGVIIADSQKTGPDNRWSGKVLPNFTPVNLFNSSKLLNLKIGDDAVRGQYYTHPLLKSNLSRRLYIVAFTKLEILNSFLAQQMLEMKKNHFDHGVLYLVDKVSNDVILTVTEQENYPLSVRWSDISTGELIELGDFSRWYGSQEEVVIGSNTYRMVSLASEVDILYSSRRMLNVTLGIVAGALIVMALTILGIAQSFVRPLLNIGKRLKSVAKGDYSNLIPVVREDEFGQLARSANQMTKDLKKSAKKIEKQIIQINAERAKSDDLLLNILPSSIADRLKENEKTIADQFKTSTVLFSDLVGFTQFSSQLTAKQLVKKLNILYSMFDDLLDKYRIEKIKTIGDALMLVSGVPNKYANHAQEMAHMALDMFTVLEKFNTTHKQSLDMRIGIHTGPIVAGVIGKKKFVYDLWGDAVNTASRMESHGEPGKIHVSESTYELLKDDFTLEKRGTIKVKGKGEMTTFFLIGK
jgi:class 3 adenylate cyclase/HAMP domain-containing protein